MCSIGDKLYIHIQADIQGSVIDIEYSPALFGMKSSTSSPVYNNHLSNRNSSNRNSSNRNLLKYDKTYPKVEPEKEGISFHPLIPLQTSKLTDLPFSERRNYFTNDALFLSLISKKKKARTLKEAIRKDYINHNIRLTLDALFPPHSMVTIDGRPYTVLDYQWTPGDWKMEVKTPSVKKSVKKVEKKKEAEQHTLLKSMPESEWMGENYSEPVSETKNVEKYPAASNANAVTSKKCPFYYVTHIQLDLYPGTTLPAELVKSLPCRHKWNSVRMAWKNVTKRKRRKLKQTQKVKTTPQPDKKQPNSEIKPKPETKIEKPWLKVIPDKPKPETKIEKPWLKVIPDKPKPETKIEKPWLKVIPDKPKP